MGNNKTILREEALTILFKWAITVFFVIWTIFFIVVNADIATAISILLTVVSSLNTFGILPVNTNEKALKQEESIQKDGKPSRFKTLWNRNLKLFFWGIVLVDLVSIGFLMIKTKTGLKKDNISPMQIQKIKGDTIADENLQFWLKKQVDEFDSILNQPLKLDNAQQVISQAYSVLCPLCDTLNRHKGQFDYSSQAFVDRLKKRADEAIVLINDDLDDPMRPAGIRLPLNIENERKKDRDCIKCIKSKLR